MNVTLAQVEVFFFKAMQYGYASNVSRKTAVLGMPGFKQIDFCDGDWRCLDRYCVTPLSSKSAGSTTIWHQNIPVWMMHYGGQYKEEAIDFLKLALRANYDESIFHGCRGPASLSHVGETFLYTNTLFPESRHFGAFTGYEKITNTRDNQLLGYHGYMGMSLLP